MDKTFIRKSRKLLPLVALIVALAAPSSVFAVFNNKSTNLQLQFGGGYGYSYYGVSRGSSFNVNPGTGIEMETGALFNYNWLGIELKGSYTTISDSHFEADGKVYRTIGSGSLLWLDPKVGYYKSLGWGKWDYFFVYAGYRQWSADYSISRLGSSEFTQDGSLNGMGGVLGGRYVTTLSAGANSAFAFQIGVFFSYAPTSEYQLDGQVIDISEASGINPGLELGMGWVLSRTGLAIMLVGKYDVIVTSFRNKPDSDSVTVSSTSGTGTTKLMLVLTKSLAVF